MSKPDALDRMSEDGEVTVKSHTELLKNAVAKGSLIEKIVNRLVEKTKVNMTNKEEKNELVSAAIDKIQDEKNSKLKQFSAMLEQSDTKMNAAGGNCELLEKEKVRTRSNLEDEIHTAIGNVIEKELDKIRVRFNRNKDLISSTNFSEEDEYVDVETVWEDYDEKKSPKHSTDVKFQTETIAENAAVRKKSRGTCGKKTVSKRKPRKSKTACAVDDGRQANKKRGQDTKKQSASECVGEVRCPSKKMHSPDVEFQSDTDRRNCDRKLDENVSPGAVHTTDGVEISSVRIDDGDIRKKSQATNGEKKAKFKKLRAGENERQVNQKDGEKKGTSKRAASLPYISIGNRRRGYTTKNTEKEKMKAEYVYPMTPRKSKTGNKDEKNSKIRIEEIFSLSEMRVPSDNKSSDHSSTLPCNHLIENLAPIHGVGDVGCKVIAQNRDLDEDEQFFISVMPSVKKLSELDKIHFRMEIIQLVRDLRKRSTTCDKV